MPLFSQIRKKKSNRDRGSEFESLACQYLIGQGFTFLESNFHCRFGELDLIMRKNQTIVFVEVKYRANQRYGHAAETVTYAKQQKLMKTATIWLKKHSLPIERTEFRFDIIAIHNNGNDINWIPNAITQG